MGLWTTIIQYSKSFYYYYSSITLTERGREFFEFSFQIKLMHECTFLEKKSFLQLLILKINIPHILFRA